MNSPHLSQSSSSKSLNFSSRTKGQLLWDLTKVCKLTLRRAVKTTSPVVYNFELLGFLADPQELLIHLKFVVFPVSLFAAYRKLVKPQFREMQIWQVGRSNFTHLTVVGKESVVTSPREKLVSKLILRALYLSTKYTQNQSKVGRNQLHRSLQC